MGLAFPRRRLVPQGWSSRKALIHDAVSRIPWVDLVLAAILAIATLNVSLYFAPRGYQAGFADMAHDGYQLRQALDLSQGAVIFRDTFDQYGPFNGYLNTIGFVALGRRLLAVKYFICGWYALIAVMLFVMARHWLDPALAAFSTIIWLGLSPFYQQGIMISPHVYVLFFQGLAAIVILRSRDLEPRRFAVVGLLAGLSWTMKQTMGTLFLAAVMAYLAVRLVSRPGSWKPALRAVIALFVAYAAVVGIVLAILWSQGALRDWYLQTVKFPQALYAGDYVSFVVSFVRLQTRQPVYWLAIRLVVMATAAVQIIRRRPADDLLLMASITAFLWLGAFPSANFMHQWWTASLTIAPCVACLQMMLRRIVVDYRVAWVSTVVVASVIVSGGVAERQRVGDSRAASLNQVLVDPPVLRGIHTDAPTKRVFEALYDAMKRYRTTRPETKIVSINTSGADSSGIPIDESLPLLSFFEENTHSQPVYWSVPVLSTRIYPLYSDKLWSEVRAEQPLIVEYRDGGYRPADIPGYVVLVGAQAVFGYWYLYAPERDRRESQADQSVFLARDGSTESAGTKEGAGAKADASLSPSPVGAWRGMTSSTAGSSNSYTWPADLPSAAPEGALEPVPDPFGRTAIVKKTGAGEWDVDGQADAPYSYLLQFDDRLLERGATLMARGQLDEGGFQLGFIHQHEWSGSVVVTQEGPFQAVLQIQRTGQYALVLANCIESTSGWKAARHHWLRGTLGMFTGKFMPNHFRIHIAWVPRLK